MPNCGVIRTSLRPSATPLSISSAKFPLRLLGGLFVAVLLNQAWLKGRMIFRGIYFLPVIVPMVVMAIVWQWMYSTNTGIFNYFLSLVGLGPVQWLTSERLLHAFHCL